METITVSKRYINEEYNAFLFEFNNCKVTDELDEGPIINQDVIHINHKNSINDIIQLGREIERTVLYKAAKIHLDHKIIVYNNKTIIFD